MLAESIDSLLKNPRMDADTPWKNILDVYFRDFLELCLPDLEKKIDWKKGYVCLDKELHKLHHDSKVKGSVVDKLIKIWPIERNATWLLIHLEVQCSRDSHFPIRMFIYKYRIFDRYKVPIISIALLADGQSKWCPNYYREEIFGCHVEMRYLVIKVLDYLPQCAKLQKIANPFAKIILAQLVILATLRNPQYRLEKKVFLTRQLFNHGWDKNRIVELFKFIDWLIALPEDFKLQYHQATQQIEEEESMGYVSTAEWVGMKKGMQQGMQQGMRQGKVEVIVQLLTRRFGQIPSKYLQEIEKAEPDKLLIWCERILDVDTIDELFQTEISKWVD